MVPRSWWLSSSAFAVAGVVVGFYVGQTQSRGAERIGQIAAALPDGSSKDISYAQPPEVSTEETGTAASGSMRMPIDPVEPSRTGSESVALRNALDGLYSVLDRRIWPPYSTEEYEAKYDGLSDDERQVVDLVLSNRVIEEATRITDAMFEQGEYETHLVPDGQKVGSPPPAQDEIGVAYGFRIESGDGQSSVKLAKIEPALYPDLESMKRESRWLKSYLRKKELDGSWVPK